MDRQAGIGHKQRERPLSGANCTLERKLNTVDTIAGQGFGGPARVARRTPDLLVIGAGSAGFSAAIRAAELGAQVALIGHGTIGGTCVNIGCVPSKTLIRAAETLHQAKEASRFTGRSARAHLDDWHALVTQKDDLVADLRATKYAALLPHYETIRYVEGPA